MSSRSIDTDIDEELDNMKKRLREEISSKIETLRNRKEHFRTIHIKNLKEHLIETEKLLNENDIRDASEKIFAAWKDYITLVFIDSLEEILREKYKTYIEELDRSTDINELRKLEKKIRREINWISKLVEKMPSGKIAKIVEEMIRDRLLSGLLQKLFSSMTISIMVMN